MAALDFLMKWQFLVITIKHYEVYRSKKNVLIRVTEKTFQYNPKEEGKPGYNI